MSIQPVTKINRMKDMWYVYIPKSIQLKLEKLGVSKDDVVIWEEPSEKQGVVVVTMRILKGVKKTAIKI